MDIDENIQQFKEAELKRLKDARKGSDDESVESVATETVDLYQRDQDRIFDVSNKTFPKGSSFAVNMATTAVIDGQGTEGLSKAYRKAKDDIAALKDMGERGRAELMRKQYMEESFLPAVEIVANSTSPDELLSNARALEELDKYAMLEGSGKGYTATYIRQAYANQLGQVTGRSDPYVRDSIVRINALLDIGENRSAYGMASQLKDQIDRGERKADDTDYDFIGRIVAFYK